DAPDGSELLFKACAQLTSASCSSSDTTGQCQQAGHTACELEASPRRRRLLGPAVPPVILNVCHESLTSSSTHPAQSGAQALTRICSTPAHHSAARPRPPDPSWGLSNSNFSTNRDLLAGYVSRSLLPSRHISPTNTAFNCFGCTSSRRTWKGSIPARSDSIGKDRRRSSHVRIPAALPHNGELVRSSAVPSACEQPVAGAIESVPASAHSSRGGAGREGADISFWHSGADACGEASTSVFIEH
ncbi:hypothetical protein BKA93DRAFT_880881, partial [Sparassis latifolia]